MTTKRKTGNAKRETVAPAASGAKKKSSRAVARLHDEAALRQATAKKTKPPAKRARRDAAVPSALTRRADARPSVSTKKAVAKKTVKAKSRVQRARGAARPPAVTKKPAVSKARGAARPPFPAAPDWLCEVGKAKWVERVGEVDEKRLDVFGMWCSSWATWQKASEGLAILKPYMRRGNGVVENPMLTMQRKAAAEMARLERGLFVEGPRLAVGGANGVVADELIGLMAAMPQKAAAWLLNIAERTLRAKHDVPCRIVGAGKKKNLFTTPRTCFRGLSARRVRRPKMGCCGVMIRRPSNGTAVRRRRLPRLSVSGWSAA